MNQADWLDQVVRTDLCTGCGACAALAPQKIIMQEGRDGFQRPQIIAEMSDLISANVHAVCPGDKQNLSLSARHRDRLWGPYEEVLEGWSTDRELRHVAASGGALSGLLAWLLAAGKVDGVVSTKEDPDVPISNVSVVGHTHAAMLEQAASRYAPSSPLEQVPALLESSGRYAFVGKPCDISALRNWAMLDPRIDLRFPFKLSFFCAGVPSPAGALEVLAQLGIEPHVLRGFRYRGKGWPGRVEAEAKDGSRKTMSYQESWGGVLSKHVQPRCRICADGIGMEADIAFADAWETDAAGYPVFEERDGRSLILVRNQIGKELIDEARAVGALHATPVSIADIAPMQPGQLRRRRELLGRLAGRAAVGLPLPRYRGLDVWRNGWDHGMFRTLRVGLGSMRRSFSRRRHKV